VVLAVAAGVVWWFWLAHRLGGSCGYSSSVKGLPHWPPLASLLVVVVVPVLLTGLSAVTQQRSAGAPAKWLVVSAITSAAAIAVVTYLFLGTRHCFE